MSTQKLFHNSIRPFQTKRLGFSLVELLVALVFISLLLAGMAKIFASSLSTFNTTNEVMGTQRVNRWALDLLSDDISQAGFVFPDRVLPTNLLANADNVPLFSIEPNQTVAGVTRIGADGNPEAEPMAADVLQFFMDIPLPIQAEWSADTDGENYVPTGASTVAPSQATINATGGGTEANAQMLSKLQPGDAIVILDSGEYGNWEHPLISTNAAGASGKVVNPIVFEMDRSVIANFTGSNLNPGIVLPHKAGVPIMFVRPAQMVRYSVRAIALDPSQPAILSPCLVRQQAGCPTVVGATIDWIHTPIQVIAENVRGFFVDVSFNGGVGWARNTPATVTTWENIKTFANTQLGTSGIPGSRSVTDAPDWFRSINCLLRLDITTRTAMQRAEYSTTGTTREFKTRAQTLMISPRNFGVGR